jgi:hypothetical protein
MTADRARNGRPAPLFVTDPQRAGDGPRPVRAGSGLALGFLTGGVQDTAAQGRVPKMVSAKRLEWIFECP